MLIPRAPVTLSAKTQNKNMLWLAAILAVIAGFVIPFYLLDPLQSRKRKRLLKKLASEHLTYAFFHPDALSGGGGERVLWQAVAAMQSKWTTCRISIYIRIHSLSNKEVAAKVKVRSLERGPTRDFQGPISRENRASSI